MRVLVTGATGFIGSAVVRELVDSGHEVLGMARSESGATALIQAGARAHRGDLEDLDSLRRGAAEADGVIHLAYFHGISNPKVATRLRILLGGSPRRIPARFAAAGADTDRRAIETFGSALAASGGPLVVAFPTMTLASGHPVTEREAPDPQSPGAVRIASEEATLALASSGVRSSVVRIPPTVHGDGDKAMVPRLIAAARKAGFAGYVGDGANRWPAVHRDDAAHLFRLALENGKAGARYHAVAEEGVPMRRIAEVIGRRLNLPATSLTDPESARRFGWLAPFVARDNHVSSELTRQQLGWNPAGPELLADIDRAEYFTSA
ncbi:SDR family oxidoreductase [Amycolatopsis sp. K13G38]|uniref:SDR family oxidoreductase n=1 Tax=Amycolatopsis acididurans TaxID=2724524 RepID=A0ABX1JB03_9PSEU|nr:SDR family oxidoreductase [Amycolatopsis acididurans]NKQ56943.1 SDR family oxidoreductase [Amycolatopsis acididurans]